MSSGRSRVGPGDREWPPLLVSACLLGLRTRLDGRARPIPGVCALKRHFCLVPVCPEQLGGSPTPRSPAEIASGTGDDVISDRARVLNQEGVDVTEIFLRGATEVLTIARLTGAGAAVLKARSPSCGVGSIYDGTFRNVLRPGSGVTASLLAREGLRLYTEEDYQGLLVG